MKTKDILTVVSVAVGTATLTVATFWAGSMDAGGEQDALAAKIANPKLVAHGVEMTLAAADARTFKAGEEPVFVLKAVNTGQEQASVPVRIAMTSSSPENRMSRMLIMPTMLWQEVQPVALKPNESKTIIISPKTKLPANTVVSVSLREAGPGDLEGKAVTSEMRQAFRRPSPGERGIVAMNFSTGAPGAQTPAAR